MCYFRSKIKKSPNAEGSAPNLWDPQAPHSISMVKKCLNFHLHWTARSCALGGLMLFFMAQKYQKNSPDGDNFLFWPHSPSKKRSRATRVRLASLKRLRAYLTVSMFKHFDFTFQRLGFYFWLRLDGLCCDWTSCVRCLLDLLPFFLFWPLHLAERMLAKSV